MDPPPPTPPPPPQPQLTEPLFPPSPAPPDGGCFESCLWFLCCCGIFGSCCFSGPLFEAGSPPP
ncbi:hypothetical protein CsatB_030740 [Cannabis sativa]